MIKLEENVVGCQVFHAFSTQKVFVWPYLAEAPEEGTVHWECSHALWLLPRRERWPGLSCLFLRGGSFPWSLQSSSSGRRRQDTHM